MLSPPPDPTPWWTGCILDALTMALGLALARAVRVAVQLVRGSP